MGMPRKKSRNPDQKNGTTKMASSRPKLHRAYYDAANVLAELAKKTGSINSLMNRFTGDKCIKMIYALAVKVLKNQQIIKEIMEKLPTESDDEANLNPILLEILIAELLFGEKSFLKYRVKNEIKYVMKHQKMIEKLSKNLIKLNGGINCSERQLVRYVRINLIKTTKENVKQNLISMGYEEIPSSVKSFEEFKILAPKLQPKQFMDDYHFDDVLVLNDQDTKPLTESQLWLDGLIAMQDKASLLALEAMNLRPGMTILDACAAPGMKTAAIASRLQNQCTLYANDQSAKRFKEMKNVLSKSGVKFKSITMDFTQIDPEKYPDLDVILLDPSCSGSGIYRRLDYKSQQQDDNAEEDEQELARRAKLGKFQLKMLQSALAFRPKRIVYCTCSRYEEENEQVIQKLIEINPDMEYQVIDPMPKWPGRGIGEYPFSQQCLRADYETTLTNGFFCCTLKRLDEVTEPPIISKKRKIFELDAEPSKKDTKKDDKPDAKRKRTQGRNYFYVTPL